MQSDVRDVKKGIPPELWRAARSQAVLRRIKVGEWIAEAIREKLARPWTGETNTRCRGCGLPVATCICQRGE